MKRYLVFSWRNRRTQLVSLAGLTAGSFAAGAQNIRFFTAFFLASALYPVLFMLINIAFGYFIRDKSKQKSVYIIGDSYKIFDGRAVSIFCKIKFGSRQSWIEGKESIEKAISHAFIDPNVFVIFFPYCDEKHILADDTDRTLNILNAFSSVGLLNRLVLIMPKALDGSKAFVVRAMWAQLRYELSLKNILLSPYDKNGGATVFFEAACGETARSSEDSLERSKINRNCFNFERDAEFKTDPTSILEVVALDSAFKAISEVRDAQIELNLNLMGINLDKTLYRTRTHPLVMAGPFAMYALIAFFALSALGDDVAELHVYIAIIFFLLGVLIVVRSAKQLSVNGGQIEIKENLVLHKKKTPVEQLSFVRRDLIMDVEIEQGLLGKILGFGNIYIQSSNKDFYPIFHIIAPKKIVKHLDNPNLLYNAKWKESLSFSNVLSMLKLFGIVDKRWYFGEEKEKGKKARAVTSSASTKSEMHGKILGYSILFIIAFLAISGYLGELRQYLRQLCASLYFCPAG